MAPWLRPFVCVTIMEILFASPPRSAVQWDVYFCASTRKGLERNLTAGEILAQMYAFKELYDIPFHSIVLMGAGEPLTNYEEVLHFIHLANDPELLNISYRNITISTCGIVPQIYRLADENIPITLAISLHAPNDRIRNVLFL